MIKILYNPLSKNGKGNDVVTKVTNHFDKIGKEYKLVNVLEIEDNDKLVASFEENDEIVVLGGDGTLHHFANRVTPYLREGKIKNKLYLHSAGTGNDFLHDLKKEVKDDLLYLNDHLTNLPTVEYNGKEKYFINGAGLGLDALICKKVNESKDKSKIAYLKKVFKALKEYHKSKVKVIVDGKEYNYSKALLTTVMYGRFLGGGMKLAPKQKRNTDELTVAIANRIPTFLLIFILPTIYFGGHIIFPGVHMLKGKHIEIFFDEDKHLQLDGEVESNIRTLKAYKKPL